MNLDDAMEEAAKRAADSLEECARLAANSLNDAIREADRRAIEAVRPVYPNFDFIKWPNPDLLIGPSWLRSFSVIEDEETKPTNEPGVITGFGPAQEKL